jgi:hypothetical protein
MAHDTSKQAAALGTGTPMERIGSMILLVREAPHGQAPAGLAEVNGLLDGALRHLAPVTVTNPAKVTAEVTDHHLNIRTFILIAHRVHLCITLSTAQHYAAGSCGRIKVELGATVAARTPSTPCYYCTAHR